MCYNMYYTGGNIMVSLRLSEEYEKKLEQVAEIEKKSKSEIIKLALKQYFAYYENEKSPYEIGKDLFGNYGSGKSNLSTDYKKILKEKLNEKYSH
jgi:predicted DNA-binding protein